MTPVAGDRVVVDAVEALGRVVSASLVAGGRNSVTVSFDPPDAGWAGRVDRPAVNFFLYDIREVRERRRLDWRPDTADGDRLVAPPLALQLSFAVTAWADAVDEEHALLSKVIEVLHASPILSAVSSEAHPLECAVARPVAEAFVEMWRLTGSPKPALSCMVRTLVPSARSIRRGPRAEQVHVEYTADPDLVRPRDEG